MAGLEEISSDYSQTGQTELSITKLVENSYRAKERWREEQRALSFEKKLEILAQMIWESRRYPRRLD